MNLIDVDGWCENLDANDPDDLIRRWEDKGVGIFMDAYTNGKGDGWLERLVDHALRRSGDAGHDGCGVIGGSCHMGLDCEAMAGRLMGPEYWILKAIEGMSTEDEQCNVGSLLTAARLSRQTSSRARVSAGHDDQQQTFAGGLLENSCRHVVGPEADGWW